MRPCICLSWCVLYHFSGFGRYFSSPVSIQRMKLLIWVSVHPAARSPRIILLVSCICIVSSILSPPGVSIAHPCSSVQSYKTSESFLNLRQTTFKLKLSIYNIGSFNRAVMSCSLDRIAGIVLCNSFKYNTEWMKQADISRSIETSAVCNGEDF